MFVTEEQQREYEDAMFFESQPYNPLQAAFQESQANRRPDDTDKINRALAAGKHVCYVEVPDYCPITDGCMGSRKILYIASHDRAEAMKEFERTVRSTDPADMESRCYILPETPTVRLELNMYWTAEARAKRDQEIPF